MDWLTAVQADGMMTSRDAPSMTLNTNTPRHQRFAQNTADGEGDDGNTTIVGDGDSDHQARRTCRTPAHGIKTPPVPQLMAEG